MDAIAVAVEQQWDARALVITDTAQARIATREKSVRVPARSGLTRTKVGTWEVRGGFGLNLPNGAPAGISGSNELTQEISYISDEAEICNLIRSLHDHCGTDPA